MNTALRAAARSLLFLAAPLALAAPPAAAPSPSATPTPARESKAEQLPIRTAVDSLSDTDAQQALELLRSKYVRSGALDEPALTRATLQGLLERLGSGATLWSAGAEPASDSPFRSEILDEQIGYVRLGSLTQGHLAEFDAALSNFKAKKVGALILDLRATPPSSDFELAAEWVKRLTPKGKLLFTIHRPSLKQEQMFTSDRDPLFQGVTVTLVHRETAGAPEVIAAVLRAVDNSLAVGQRTSGQAAEFVNLPLHGGGRSLRVAIAEVKLPQNWVIFPNGFKPDLAVEVSAKDEQAVLLKGLEKGVGGLVYETERVHLNEASLVAGTNPEIDAEEAQQSSDDASDNEVPLYDTALQRAVDLVTTIRIIGGKAN